MAVFLLLGSGVLQGIAWCASSICTNCSDDNSQNRDFDTALMGGASTTANGSSAGSQGQTGGQSSSQASSSRNFVKKGSASE